MKKAMLLVSKRTRNTYESILYFYMKKKKEILSICVLQEIIEKNDKISIRMIQNLTA